MFSTGPILREEIYVRVQPLVVVDFFGEVGKAEGDERRVSRGSEGLSNDDGRGSVCVEMQLPLRFRSCRGGLFFSMKTGVLFGKRPHLSLFKCG